jgi:hypothetical protein
MKKEARNLFESTDPKDVAWRVEQAKIDNFIEGVTPDPEIEAYVFELDKAGITDVSERIRRIGEFIKAKEKGAK